MTPDSADDPADSSEGNLPATAPGDGENGAPTAAATGVIPALKAKRSQKQTLKKELKARLGDWSFFAQHDAGDPIRFVVEGEDIGKDSGSAEAIGQMIVRLSKLFETLGGRPQLQGLTFGNSVTIELRSPKSEIKRANESLAAARRIAKSAGEKPSQEQEAEIELALHGALTDMVVAAELASTLISTPSQQAPEVAVAFGGEVAGAYRTLAKAVARERVTLVVEAPTREKATLTPSRAERVDEELGASTEPLELEITAFGTLSVANKELHGFGLRLDPDATRHAMLRGKRVVNGTYLPALEAKIRDEGLWGREVRAKLKVVRDALISTSTVRPATYTLIDVEPRQQD
jgi:hypothetical protein